MCAHICVYGVMMVEHRRVDDEATLHEHVHC